MRFKTSHMILYLFCLLPLHLYPQQEKLDFQHYTVEDGMSAPVVSSMLQDKNGFLWFGTWDGVDKFDGYSFTRFRNDPANPDSISYNSISALYEDTDGYLWVGTLGGGLNRYDPKTGKFAHYFPFI